MAYRYLMGHVCANGLASCLANCVTLMYLSVFLEVGKCDGKVHAHTHTLMLRLHLNTKCAWKGPVRVHIASQDACSTLMQSSDEISCAKFLFNLLKTSVRWFGRTCVQRINTSWFCMQTDSFVAPRSKFMTVMRWQTTVYGEYFAKGHTNWIHMPPHPIHAVSSVFGPLSLFIPMFWLAAPSNKYRYSTSIDMTYTIYMYIYT